MNQEQAKKLLPLVNNYEDFELVKEYARNRIEELKNDLLQAQDFHKVKEIQGKIWELQRFETLRALVLDKAKG